MCGIHGNSFQNISQSAFFKISTFLWVGGTGHNQPFPSVEGVFQIRAIVSDGAGCKIGVVV